MKRDSAFHAPVGNAGFTLVELMVGVLIAMLAMLLITEVYSNAIWRKRDISGGSEAQRTASMTLYQIANSLKQAGSIVAQSQEAWGCTLRAAKNGTTLLPLPKALPVPFENLPTTLRLAPVIVRAGVVGESSRESDLILAISSGLESSGIAFKIREVLGSDKFVLSNSNGFVAGDLLLTTNSASGNCNVTQIAADHGATYTDGKLDNTPQSVTVGGMYAMSTALGSLAIGDQIYGLGRAPQFNVFGVASQTQSLEMYDLLQMHGLQAPAPIAENVFLLKAIYGIATGTGGVVNKWVSPTDAGWTFSDLQSNTDTVREKLGQIKAIRIALITRGSYPAATESFQDKLELFGSTGLKQTITLTKSEQRYRYQIYESVIPLFNTRDI